jgi:hypothetical protein
MSEHALNPLPQVITQLFKPFGVNQHDSTLDDPAELYIAAFTTLMGKGESNATQTYTRQATLAELTRSEPYTDENVDLGWGTGDIGEERFGVGRAAKLYGLVAVSGLKPKVEAFLAISVRDSSLEGKSWHRSTQASFGFKLPETIATDLFGKPDKSFEQGHRHQLGKRATAQAFGLSIKALENLI